MRRGASSQASNRCSSAFHCPKASSECPSRKVKKANCRSHTIQLSVTVLWAVDVCQLWGGAKSQLTTGNLSSSNRGEQSSCHKAHLQLSHNAKRFITILRAHDLLQQRALVQVERCQLRRAQAQALPPCMPAVARDTNGLLPAKELDAKGKRHHMRLVPSTPAVQHLDVAGEPCVEAAPHTARNLGSARWRCHGGWRLNLLSVRGAASCGLLSVCNTETKQNSHRRVPESLGCAAVQAIARAH